MFAVRSQQREILVPVFNGFNPFPLRSDQSESNLSLEYPCIANQKNDEKKDPYQLSIVIDLTQNSHLL